MACIELLNSLSESVDNTNLLLIDNMTDATMKYENACIKPNLTFDFFYENLKKEWEHHVNEFIRKDTCGSHTSLLLLPLTLNKHKKFELDRDITKSIFPLMKIFGENCYCHTLQLLKTLLGKYSGRIINDEKQMAIVFEKYNKLAEIIKSASFVPEDFKEQYKTYVPDLSKLESGINPFHLNKTNNINGSGNGLVGGLASDPFEINDYTELMRLEKLKQLKDHLISRFVNLYSFSVESEMNKLIPDELGSLKQFFIKIITTYYNNLDPIIWAQMMKQMMDNIFIDLPYTKDELFRFVSKYVLLNSGPFILKILQMIRPVLSPELATKYNLTKLTYPLMTKEQTTLIFSKVLPRWDMCKVLFNKSASVGHVAIMYYTDNPTDIFVVKIIKPLVIAQSCWEYNTLHNIFPEGSCENTFVRNMLESNGAEMNVANEMDNVNKGHEYYTTTYSSVFGTSIDATLTTLENKPGVVMPDCWFALATTLAPGIPVSDLVESDLLTKDTLYRAKLHRCLDLLIYKFFITIVQKGFYHGDLHAGNIFFSYKESKMTLIDFGAVGEIDLFEGNEDIATLLDIIIMSLFYNYEGIFDTMTELLNRKCTSNPDDKKIDTSAEQYQKFKHELHTYHMKNIANSRIYAEKMAQFKQDVFDDERINAEARQINQDDLASMSEQVNELDEHARSIYRYFNIKSKEKEIVVENKDILPEFTEISEDNKSMTFSKVLELIIKFYSNSGVNVATTFGEFYELQKAYSLLLGVLYKTGYSSYRTGIAMKKAILTWSNIPELLHLKTTIAVSKKYLEESSKFEELKKIALLDKLASYEYPQEQRVQSPVQDNSNQLARLLEATQVGGGNKNNAYKYKYMKYKAKYMQLHNN
ncbi:MAG: hypothetical protein Terrestrivirus13_2 [Terrestrivirus sp.]|uniref:ABC1 atypical kinase-like domain-containing protein n=1 Tax=Terrestrivirus sp. TaxID=2487775 RepID=A0A3G4ZPC7_9VIRU|nr:MAG: hypothetical protein Terrestrivirus13_2 [Terrestrivirus sp.]